MKTVFITGTNGLLGTNLCHDLLDNGYKVKGLVRSTTKYKGKKHTNLELIEGHLFEDLTAYLYDVDIVIHIAATTAQNLLRYEDYWIVNYNATIQLFNAAVKCNVKQFIFVSTANTLGYGSLESLGSERIKIRPPFHKSYYAKSKLEAETYLLQNQHKLQTVIVNPTFMLGAYDTKPSSGKMLLFGWKKKVIFYPPGGKNFVHVKDVSLGILNAIDKGKSGERYLLAHQNLSYKSFFLKLNTIAKQQPIMFRIPKAVLLLLGSCGSLLQNLGIKTSLNLTNAKILCIHNYFSNQKSIEDLQVNYQPVENAIKDGLHYFSTQKQQSNA